LADLLAQHLAVDPKITGDVRQAASSPDPRVAAPEQPLEPPAEPNFFTPRVPRTAPI
jgi:hypothetical protein